MKRYDEEFARREKLKDRAESRRRYIELMDSGKVKSAFSVVVMEAEPGDDPGTERMALITDGATMEEAGRMVRHALGALTTMRRADEPEHAKPPPERIIEAQGRLAEHWLRYADAMDMETAPPPVYTLVRKTFYAGIAALYAELVDHGDPSRDPDNATALVEALHAELRAFCLEDDMMEEPKSHARH